MTAYDQLDQLRKDIAANADSLAEAKARQKAVFAAANTFDGSLRTYKSGSVATRFTNDPVSDADGGVVMGSCQLLSWRIYGTAFGRF